LQHVWLCLLPAPQSSVPVLGDFTPPSNGVQPKPMPDRHRGLQHSLRDSRGGRLLSHEPLGPHGLCCILPAAACCSNDCCGGQAGTPSAACRTSTAQSSPSARVSASKPPLDESACTLHCPELCRCVAAT
jgi:hypothetical protein